MRVRKRSARVGSKGGKLGRPAKLSEQLTPQMMADARRVGRVHGTKQDLADLWGMSVRTLERWDDVLGPLMRAKAAESRLKVRERQLESALQGQPVAQIWWGKNNLGQTDRQQVTGAGGGPIEFVSASIEHLSEVLGRLGKDSDD